MRLRALRRATALLVAGVALLALVPTASADEGWATWYGPGFDGKRMANGQIFDMNDPTTVASNYLAFGTWLKVTNTANGKSVWVQVRDRGPFGNAGVKLDLSYAASAAIAQTKPATMWVRFEIVSGPGAEPTAPTSTPLPATWTLGPMPTRTPTRTPTPAPLVPTSTPTRTPFVPTNTPLPPPTTTWTPTATWTPTSTSVPPTPSAVTSTPTATPVWTATAAPTQQAKASATATPRRSAAEVSLTPAPARYVVRPGETLWSIVRRYGLDIDDVQEANGLTSPDSLRAGQTLVLGVSQASPVPTPETAAALAPAPTPTVAAPSRETLAEPTPPAPVEPAAAPLVGATGDRVAATGANVLSDVALATGIRFETLARANDLGKSASVIGDSPAPLAQLPVEAEAPSAIAEAPNATAEAPTTAAEAPTITPEAPTATAEAPTATTEASDQAVESGAVDRGQLARERFALVVRKGGALFEAALQTGADVAANVWQFARGGAEVVTAGLSALLP